MEEKRVICINDKNYNANIYIERRNSIRVSITKNGINIRIPRYLGRRKQKEEIDKLIEWARGRIESNPGRVEDKSVSYYHGNYVRTHSKIYKLDIEIRDSHKNFAKIKGNIVILKIAGKHSEYVRQKYISKQLQKLLAKEHLPELKDHVERLNGVHFRRDIKKISYRYTRSRWGVCKIGTKEIELSTRLLLAPLPVLEYVIIHELAHLLEANHSKRFWNIVRSVDPYYKRKTKWLKVHGHTLNI